MTDRPVPTPLLRLSTLALRLGGPSLSAPALPPARLALIRRRMVDGFYDRADVAEAVVRAVNGERVRR
jgi:hypothetical protein